jgi:hypothetical protein
MAEEFTQDEQLTRSYADAVDLDARAAEVLAARTAEDAAANPCEIWHDIRPLVVAISELFFIPKNIRKVLTFVIAVADALCPR